MKTAILALILCLITLSTASAQVDVVVEPVRDVLQGESVYYPVIIKNQDTRTHEVILGLEGMQGWGTYRIDPAPIIVIQPGEQRQVFVYLRANPDAPPGVKDFTVTTTYGNSTQSAPLRIAVLQPVREEFNYTPWIVGGVILLILIAGIVAAVLLRKETEEEDEDLITYY